MGCSSETDSVNIILAAIFKELCRWRDNYLVLCGLDYSACQIISSGTSPSHSEIQTLENLAYTKKYIEIQYIRIFHECEGRIEKSVPRIAVWHHEACRVMTNGDPMGRIILSYPNTNKGFFFLLTTVFLYENKLPEVPEYAKMQFHMMTSLKNNNDVN